MKQTLQTITRKGNMSVCHRVMFERCKCFSVHGHEYLYELTFSFTSMPELDNSYAIDFKELKRVGIAWIDDLMDHGAMLNPHDHILIEAINKLGTKLWLMSLAGKGEFCNPSVENIAKEMFLAMKILFDGRAGGLQIHEVKVWETPNCWTTCTADSITIFEEENFRKVHQKSIEIYKENKGVFDYDARSSTEEHSHIEN